MNAISRGAPSRVLIVTAANSRFFGLLRGMLDSIRPVLERPEVDLACFDIGLTAEDREWLSDRRVRIAVPGSHFGLPAEDHSPALRSFLARPFLPSYFPGHTIYVWIDSDIWLQDTGVFDAFVQGAADRGLAIAHESERSYRFQAWLLAWTTKHFVLGYGALRGLRLVSRTHVNAGFFAAAGNAPHWDAWARRYEAAIRRTGSLVPHDQFALNQALHDDFGGRVGASLLEPACNWICDRGVPMWSDEAGAFCKPYPPYDVIGALHLAGPGKSRPYRIVRTGGGSFTSFLLRGASPETPIESASQIP